jgi:hypothetical protein
MNRQQLLDRIGALVVQERELRSRLQAGELSPDEEQRKIRQLDTALDRCWDLLRRRHAARHAGIDPDSLRGRPLPDIEDHLR